MVGFDFDSALRWARFARQNVLARRSDAELTFVDESMLSGQGLLLDTCVYIDQLQNRSPVILDSVIKQRQVNHSTIAIQELMHAVGVLNPADARTSSVIAEIRKRIYAMPPHRIFAPDPDSLGKAALLAGILCRLQSYAHDHRLRALHDCVLFLQAQKLGLVVLTADAGDFDILLQLVPKGRVLFYRRNEET